MFSVGMLRLFCPRPSGYAFSCFADATFDSGYLGLERMQWQLCFGHRGPEGGDGGLIPLESAVLTRYFGEVL